ncbi:MAG: lamin tail domain-containing protein [Candidatus Paceibacterota bacterium]|jgi:hypothetical protein
MTKKVVSCVFVLFCAFASFEYAHAYDDETTHPALTSEVISFYNSTHPDKLFTEEQRNWIVEGSKLEDVAPRWINHFYDPILKEGWTGEKTGSIAPLAVRMVAEFGLAQGKPLSAVEWVNNDLRQGDYIWYEGNKTWKKALDEYASGNEREAYIALGHVLHLLEDMSVPDHTRNDTHAPLGDLVGDEGSPFETYLAKSETKLNIANALTRLDKQEIQESSIEDHLAALAVYSNKYFFSKDTINDPKYRFPKILKEDVGFGYGQDEDGHFFPLVKSVVQKNIEFQTKINHLIEETDKDIFNAYFSRLSKQVVLHGAGVIDLFYKQAEDAKINKEFPTHIVQFDKAWGRLPIFSFVGEIVKLKISISNRINSIRLFTNKVLGYEKLLNKMQKKEVITNLEEEEATDFPKEESETPIIDIDEGVANKVVESVLLDTDALENAQKDEEVANNNVSEENIASTNSNKVKNEIKYTSSGGGSPSNNSDSNTEWLSAEVRIVEIMYDLPGTDEKREWIEILNEGNSGVVVENMKFVEKGINHTLSLVRGTSTLPSNAYAIIASDAEQFLIDHPSFQGTLLDSTFSLSNEGETIALKGGTRILNEITYATSTGAHGDGNSLQLVEGVWRALSPTPGEKNIYTPPPMNQAPNVVFRYTPLDPQVGDIVQFDAASSTDTDGSIIFYQWNFGDSTTASSSYATTTHTFSGAGTYISTLTLYDNENSSSSRSVSIAVAPRGSRGVNHVIISEIQVGGVDAGEEFIELYNPSAQALDLSLWSLQYASGSAESVSSSTVFKKNFSTTSVINPNKFFLIARTKNGEGKDGYTGLQIPDLSHRSFSLSGAAAGGKIFLVRNQDEIESESDPDIVDMVDYAAQVPVEGMSIERKAWVSNACVSSLAGGVGEFLGHGCDSDEIIDFEVRANPNPQNSTSLLEPRTAPTTPMGIDGTTTSIVSYSSSSLTLSFHWQPSIDFEGATSSLFYKLYEVSGSSTLITTTTEPSYSMSIKEIGRVYAFELIAEDREGFHSATSTFNIEVPSFFTSLYFYQDPTNGSPQYLTKAFFDAYPFVSQKYIEGDASKMVVFYANTDAAKKEMITPTDAGAFSDVPGVIGITTKRCGGSIWESSYLVLRDGNDNCAWGPTVTSDVSPSQPQIEPTRFLFSLGMPSGVTYSSSDYFTVAFYDAWPYVGPWGSRAYELVAVDKKHYQFGVEPRVAAPHLPDSVRVDYDRTNSKITVNWDKATDVDSMDSELLYEINISPRGGLDESKWQAQGTKLSYVQEVNIEEAFLIAVRVKDEFGNVSETRTIEWQTPLITMHFSQGEVSGWSDRWGTLNQYSSDPTRASFQRIVPQEDFAFNTAAVRLSIEGAGDPRIVRLSVFPEDGSHQIDFTNPLARSSINNLSTTNKESDSIFPFDSPVVFTSSTPYWFVFDAAESSNLIGFYRTSLQNGVAVGNVYGDGYAGWGYAQGPDAVCSASCRFVAGNSVGDSDWYLKLGMRE